MTKRLLSLFLVCILAIPIFVVSMATPAYAYSTLYEEHMIENVQNIYTIIQQWYIQLLRGGWYTAVSDWLDDIDLYVVSIYDRLVEWTEETFATKLYIVLDMFFSGNENLEQPGLIPTLINQFNGLSTAFNVYISNLETTMVSWFDMACNWLSQIDANIISFWEDIVSNVQSFQTSMETWWTTLDTKMKTVLSNLSSIAKGDNTSLKEFDSNETMIDNEKTEYAENMGIVQEATRPEYEDVDTDLNAQLPGTSQGYATDFFAAFFASQYIYIVFFLAFSFALISFVIFGKR